MGWWLFLVHLPILSTINHFACFPNRCPESIFPSHVWWLFSVSFPHSPRCDLILPTFTSYLDNFMGSVLCDIITLWPDLLFVGPQPSLTIYLRRKPPWTSESIVRAPSRVPRLQQHLLYPWHHHTRVWQNLTEPSAITQLSPSLPKDRNIHPRPVHSQLCFLTWGFPAKIPLPVLLSSSLPPPGNHSLFPPLIIANLDTRMETLWGQEGLFYSIYSALHH